MIVTIISRGQSGTRTLSHILTASGFYMGSKLNKSGDLTPTRGKLGDMYKACGLVGDYVKYLGGFKWDFSTVLEMEPPDEFVSLVKNYLECVLNSDEENKGWKLPETILAYPWIVKMFPDNKYIYLIRDPVDCILGEHPTDDLSLYNVPVGDGVFESKKVQKIISWKYQFEIFKATPKPKNLIEIRFEDLVVNQERTLKKLEDFLKQPMTKIKMNPDPAGRAVRTMLVDDREKLDAFFVSELLQYDYR